MQKIISISFFLILACINHGYAQLTSTNLPIVRITTSSTINDTVQIQGTLEIISNASNINTPADAPVFNGMIGVKQTNTNGYPKISLSVETWSAPLVSQDTALLGMPSENDWVLVSSYEDRSLARGLLSLKLHEKMGRYAPRMQYCELIVNNQYQGIYLFGEKIKRDANRVNISKLTTLDTSGVNLTGGYIFSVSGGNNGWTSLIPPPFATLQTIKFQYDTPDPSVILPSQQNYIMTYVDSFENALNSTTFQDTLVGWRKFGSITSFIDYMIITELSKDLNAYRKNSYLYKNKSGKLKLGPLFGQEIAWKNTSGCNSNLDTGWAYNLGAVCGTENRLAPFWYNKLSTDTSFIKDLKCKYTNYRISGGALDTTTIFNVLDSVKNYLTTASGSNNAIARNFLKWPIWGVPIVNEPLPMATNYATEMANMKLFIKARLTWLDSKWLQPSCLFPLQVNTVFNDLNTNMYPNPTTGQLFISTNFASNEIIDISISNIQGVIIKKLQSNHHLVTINTADMPTGVYVVQIKNKGNIMVEKMVKE